MSRIPSAVGALLFACLAGCGGDSASDQSPLRAATPPVVTGAGISGTIVGIPVGAQVTLTNNGGDAIVVRENGYFAFPTRVGANQSYRVAVSSQSVGTVCTVRFGAGTITTSATDRFGTEVLCGPASQASFQVAAGPVNPRRGATLVAMSDGRAIAIGRDTTSFSITLERYDPAADRWSAIGALPGTIPVNGAFAMPGNKVVVVTSTFDGNPVRVYTIDAANATVTAGAPATALIGPVAFAAKLLDGRILVGTDGAAQIYAPTFDTWTTVDPAPLAYGGAALLGDGKVLVQGETSTGVFDPSNGRWSTFAATQGARSGATLVSLPDGRVLAIGGFGPSGGQIATHVDYVIAGAEVFDPALGVWLPAGTFESPRVGFTATLMPSGKVLVVGGNRVSGVSIVVYPQPIPTTLDSVVSYDPTTNAWSPFARLLMPRTRHGAALLAEGKLLVAGGYRSIANDPPTVSAEDWTDVSATTSEIGW